MITDYASGTDSQLWSDFKEGSREAYSFIYQKYAPVLYNYGYKIVQDRALVEDCIQDLFVHLITHRRNLSHTDSIRFYLYKALRREITGKLRSLHKHPSDDVALPFDLEIVFSPESLLIENQTFRERQEGLLKALNELPPRQKEAVFLRFYDNLGYEELASVMGIDQRSAYKIIYKAIDSLHKRLVCELGFISLLMILLTG